MKLTFPHMGTAYIPFRALIEGLAHEAIVPPECTQKTLALGARHAPESACLPLKINIGNYLEAWEKGAEAILMAGGIGPCRFGFYGYVEQEILLDLDIPLQMFILEPPCNGWRELGDKLRQLAHNVSPRQVVQASRLAWAKFVACDRIEQLTHVIRAYEIQKGSTTRVLRNILYQIDCADTVTKVREAVRQGQSQLGSLPQEPGRSVLIVGIVGEIYTVLEPFVNFHLEEYLGEMGVVVRRQLWFSDWILHHIVLSTLRLKNDTHLYRLARPYLEHFVGGHGLESVAHSVALAKEGVDGIVHILPFTCMPEIVAQSVLPLVSRDYQIPILTIVVDEHSAEAGIQTRLEAFVDLLASRRQGRYANLHKLGGRGEDRKGTRIAVPR